MPAQLYLFSLILFVLFSLIFCFSPWVNGLRSEILKGFFTPQVSQTLIRQKRRAGVFMTDAATGCIEEIESGRTSDTGTE